LRRAVAATALAAGSAVLAACTGGPIGQSAPLGNGKNFVSGDSGVTVYPAGSRPGVPAVTGTTLTGSKLSLSAYRGHVVVLNFWGSWCTPCRAEAPAFARLARHFRPAGVRFLGVDIRDSKASAQAFIRNFGISYPSLNDPGDVIALDFHSTVPPAGTPTTLVIGPDGRITARVVGQSSYRGLAGLITRAARPA
jgi:thiol-disulfide isomerase/thioredoxin